MSEPQHIRHNEKPDVAPADVNLIQMGDAPVARGHSDVAELDVHVVFGYLRVRSLASRRSRKISRLLQRPLAGPRSKGRSGTGRAKTHLQVVCRDRPGRKRFRE